MKPFKCQVAIVLIDGLVLIMHHSITRSMLTKFYGTIIFVCVCVWGGGGGGGGGGVKFGALFWYYF